MVDLVYPRGSWWEKVNEHLFRQRIATAFRMAGQATLGFSPTVTPNNVEFRACGEQLELVMPVGCDVQPFIVAISDTLTLIPHEIEVPTHDLIGPICVRRAGFLLWEDVQISAGYDDPGGWEPKNHGFFQSPYGVAVYLAKTAFDQSVTDVGEQVEEILHRVDNGAVLL